MNKKTIKTILSNKKAFYNYLLDTKYIAGIKLLGNEVKSIRLGKVNLDNSYIKFNFDEVFIINMLISKYPFCNIFHNYNENRERKLLLNKREILQIKNKIQTKGFIVIPIRILIIKNLVKIEISLAKGKKKYDKRSLLKEKELDLKIKKMIKKDDYY
ncbi:MAG: SsrA-binding protein [Candidatus Phytoplasma cynodontis]|uniref:SsrA-binding protein SmpB n=1 Tax='Cynodon dactylon' phytoplasma TaxID=295320 RepID=UPI001265C437|nr:SsrA-binding protein SmpB ['Cynodon dactylon' phytoplasma]KAB8121739.1 SsrA-binding protein SmpB ['Cynodon dactylon' phytoplasma]WIA07767.1 MAG: SsrA-binding protein [Candidatus Phytoplasma cynodontis]